MASKDTLYVFTPLSNEPPSSNYATFDTRNSVPVLDFDASTQESAVFGGVLPTTYDGGGLDVDIVWMAGTATAGTVVWGVGIEAHPDDAFDIDSDGFAANNLGTSVAPSATGEQQYITIQFTNGADMDSLAAGESFRLRVQRVVGDAQDAMGGDAELLRVTVKET